MSNQGSSKKYVQTESVQTRDAVGENVMQTMGGSINFAMDTLGINHQFKLNGPYAIAAGKNDIDGALIFDWKAEIFEVQLYSFTAGTGGTTTIDIKYSPTRNGPFTSIFTTQPSVSFNATHPTYVGTGDVVSPPANTVAPVLTALPFPIVAGGWLRCDVTSTMSGGARDCGVVVKYRPIS